MTDKRHTDRTSTAIAGRLLSAQLDVPCTILDLSSTGARVQVQPGLFLPKLLSLRAKELGADRLVQVVWRNRTQIGVHFGGGSRA